MRLKAINYLSSWSLMCEKKKGGEGDQECFILLSVSNGLVPVQKSAELQGNFITRSSTSLKVATERSTQCMRHYPFLPVGREWLGVSGHIWSFAAQGQINNVYSEAFRSFLRILSERWMKKLWFSTHLMDRWWAPDGSHFILPTRTRVVLHGSLVEHEDPDV